MPGENILSYTDLKAKQYSKVIQKLPWYWLQHEVTLHGDIGTCPLPDGNVYSIFTLFVWKDKSRGTVP